MIINIAHQKGGVGKSTLAINLSISMNATILDLDNQHSTVLFNKNRILNKLPSLECYTIQNKDLKKAEEEFLQFVKKYSGFDNDQLLIIDSGGYDSTLNRLAIICSDFIITPIAPSQIELFGLEKFELILKDASKKFNQNIATNVVINNADVRSKSDILKLKVFIKSHKSHLHLMNTIIHNRKDFKTAYAAGMNVVELDPNSKAADEIQDLIREIKINT